jgi:hypothetical protein
MYLLMDTNTELSKVLITIELSFDPAEVDHPRRWDWDSVLETREDVVVVNKMKIVDKD